MDVINSDDLSKYERFLNVKFGKQLREYLTTYGYLGYKHIEFMGITGKQGLYSDMVRNTSTLHFLYPVTGKFTVFENLGDGVYSLVDADDNMYYFPTESNKIIKINLKLFEYIAKRFSEISGSIV